MEEIGEGDVWGGVPPPGERSTGDRRLFILGIVAVILAEWALWATYRYITAPLIGAANSDLGFIFHIFAAPIIGLTPILVYWRFVRKEKGWPWKFTRKKLFSSMLVGAAAAAILMLLYQGASWLVLVISGYGIPSQTYFISIWRGSSFSWFILMSFTYFFIVGPVEELQYRSFMQDQLGRVMRPGYGLLIASAFFAASHLPVYFFVYELSVPQALFALCWTFTMGSVLGVFYFQSRNIMGPIVMHGLWDWILSVWALEIGLSPSYAGIGILGDVLWLIALIPMALVTLAVISVIYHALWKGNRPDNSFGIGPVPLMDNIVRSLGRKLRATKAARFLNKNDSAMVPIRKRVVRSTLAVIGVCLMVMLFSAPGMTIDEYIGSRMRIAWHEGSNMTISTSMVSFDSGIYVNEGGTEVMVIPVNETAEMISFKLTMFWTDEYVNLVRFENTPDTFSMEVEIPGVETFIEPPTDSGSIIVNWDDREGIHVNGTISVMIRCVEAGNIVPLFNPIGLRERDDNGNDVTVGAQIEYLQ
jgi:membrane protease YdiL (CAAX protease family)